jgi:hypothetical protein
VIGEGGWLKSKTQRDAKCQGCDVKASMLLVRSESDSDMSERKMDALSKQ